MSFLKILFWFGVVYVTAMTLDVMNGRRPGNIPIKRKSVRVIVMGALGIVMVLGFWNLMQAAKVLAGII